MALQIVLLAISLLLVASQEPEDYVKEFATYHDPFDQIPEGQSKEMDADEDGQIPWYPKCHQNMPTLSVGDIELKTIEDWEKAKKEIPLFIVGISAGSCEECCQHEPLFARFMHEREGGIRFKGKEIPVMRIDADQRVELLTKANLLFPNYPVALIVHKG
jgi:hypothetical protein